MAVFLQPIVGWLSPPSHRHRRRDPWVFEPLDTSLSAQFVQPTSLAAGLLKDFEGPDHVVGLYWNGSLVAVRVPHGLAVEVKPFEDRRWTRHPRAEAS